MKIIKLCIVAIGVISTTFNTYAQTADEIIQKHLTAIGGIDNWKKVNTIKIVGSTNAGGTEIPIVLTVQQGKGFRVEYTVNGMTGYSIITDKTGWNYNPFGGQTKADVVPDETIKQSQDVLDIAGPIVDYKAKGNKITYVGKDDVEGTECFKLKVVYPNGKEETDYIDASTYYHIKSVSKIKANDKEVESTQTFGNFQKLPEGIVYAMSIDNGGGAVAIKSIEINKPIDESAFKPSEVKATETRK